MEQCLLLAKTAMPIIYSIVDLDVVKDAFPILNGFSRIKDIIPTLNSYADTVFGAYKIPVLSCTVVGVGGGCYLAYRKYFTYIDEKRKLYPRDVVILHQLVRAPCAPSMSPECMKLETYLRMAKIPYQNEFGLLSSAKFRMPWITYNDCDVSECDRCIDFLNAEFKVKLDHQLDTRDKAITTAFRTCIESDLYFLMTYQLWYTDSSNPALEKMMGLRVRWVMRYTIYLHALMNGQAGKTQRSRELSGTSILRAINTLIGDKRYTMGEVPCELDAVVFGYVCMALYHLFDSEYQRCILEELPNLSEFIERMKEEYYNDWDSIIVGLD